MTRLLLVRHGQTSWNALGRLQGHTDIELDDTGRDQARALAGLVAEANLARVWTSDLARARETGAIVARALGLAEPAIEPDLRERKFGVFEGLTRDECATRHPDAWAAWLAQTGAPPGGEPRDAAIARFAAGLRRIASADPRDALVVTHGGVMRLWLMTFGDPVPLIPNGAIYTVAYDGDAFVRVD